MRLLLSLGIAAFCFCNQAIAAANPLTVDVNRKPALALQLPDGWSSEGEPDKTTINAGKHEVHVQLWPLADVKSMQEALPRVADLIKSEVAEFKAGKTRNLTVAGAPAKHIIGTGTEADDGDPSNAEVYLFTVGGRVFLLCAHGEGAGASNARADIARLLATARKP